MIEQDDKIIIRLVENETRGTVQVQDEPVRVTVTEAGPPSGGSGDGVDLVARQKADQAKATAVAVQVDLQAHKAAPQPHTAYDDDIPDLSLIFKNGLI